MKTSIIMLCHNQLHLTIDCIESLTRFTDGEYELILVNNGSSDQTAQYLQKLELWRDNVRLVFNDGNLGFPRGVNMGLRMATGDYIVLINNDVIVTPEWDTRLRAHLDDPTVGIVCAATDFCGNEAMVPGCDYRSLVEMLVFADGYTKDHAGVYEELPMVGFYCVMFRREILERVGLLDERFTPGYFEDDDYCVRVRREGYTVGVARDVFVHHAHQGTFRSIIERAGDIVSRSQREFERKWGVKVEKEHPLDYAYIEEAVAQDVTKIRPAERQPDEPMR